MPAQDRNRLPRYAQACILASAALVAGLGCATIRGILGSGEEHPAASDASAAAGSTAAPEAAPATADLHTATPAPVTIQWWSYETAEDRKALMLGQAREFEQSHPNVIVVLTALDRSAYSHQIGTVLASDKPPHLFQSEGNWSFAEFAAAGLLMDLSAEAEAGWGAEFLPAALDRFVWDGRQYGVPKDASVVGLWYNKALFRQAGITAPPSTWADFLSAIAKFKAAGITPIAVGEGDKWSGAFWWEYLALRLGGRAAIDAALSRRGAFTDPPFVQAGEELVSLIERKPFEPDHLALNTYPDASAIFGDGKAAMHLMGQWERENQKIFSTDGQGLGGDLEWFPFPALAGGDGHPADLLGGINGWLIAKDAPPEALEFLHFLISPEQQCREAGLGNLPAAKSAGVCIQDPYLEPVWQALTRSDFLQVYYDVFLTPAAGQMVDEAVYGLFAGTLTPAEAARAIENAYTAENP
ncbi:MAG: extracellular solute-binding protein [Anaerolineales bacterium]|nr:extracellular solute-binding protein [Anaerolineales bacterium]